MHSPVLINFDPAFDMAEDYSDWYYYSDDFYDGEGLEKGPVAFSQSEATHRKTHKRRRETLTSARKKRKTSNEGYGIMPPSRTSPDSEYSPRGSSAPVVMWRERANLPQTPIVTEEDGKKVALLRDWRERLNWPVERRSATQTSKSMGPSRMRASRNGSVAQSSKTPSRKTPAQYSGNTVSSKRALETAEMGPEGEDSDDRLEVVRMDSGESRARRKIKPPSKRATTQLKPLQEGGNGQPTAPKSPQESENVVATGNRKSKRLKRG